MDIRIGNQDGPILDTTIYTKRTLYKNVTVEILESENGKISLGWKKQPNTEEIEEFEDYD